MVAPDLMQEQCQQSNSIRTFFQDKAMGVDPAYINYSKNKKL